MSPVHISLHESSSVFGLQLVRLENGALWLVAKLVVIPSLHDWNMKWMADVLVTWKLTWQWTNMNRSLEKSQQVYATTDSCFVHFGTRQYGVVCRYRELKHQAFLLSRRPTGTKLSADVAYLNTSCGCVDRRGGVQAAFCLNVGLCFVLEHLGT